MSEKQDIKISAEPVKSFFVSMLTRDIHLEDAILDLLDNCVDGILRSNPDVKNEKPYNEYFAKITFSKEKFSIEDNCGGIPVSSRDYAFRMGRPNDRPSEVKGTVGVYGIGMKRAIFKIGRQCIIDTRNKNDSYKVEITPAWIKDEKDWQLLVEQTKRDSVGTTITITELNEGTTTHFENKDFFSEVLKEKIAEQYAMIIEKGFKISLNDNEIKPSPIKLIFAEDSKDGEVSIRPYIFRTTIDEVDVFLAVGFTTPIISDNEALDEQDEPRYSSQNAGWTIICNDRVVLYCDRSELTGWGEAGVPRYHTQFIAIAGMVEFRSSDASKLPTTTTKRGIDASSTLYLKIKNKMREGMKQFTDYTNRWKGNIEESKKHFKKTTSETIPLNQIKEEFEVLPTTEAKNLKGKQYIPNLPKPQQPLEESKRQIKFIVEKKRIDLVADYLNVDNEPSNVGRSCFELVYKEATK
ncbi:MAG: ATP-binding protein [Planctomycetaceae bacterium]|jgi:hypothetical protein|nr:ATP-binding protein [Planctomycetaceae bacterium]